MTDWMYCKVGKFHWNLDWGECPNHGPELRTGEDPNGVSYSGCCSQPDPDWDPPTGRRILVVETI